MVCPRIFDQNKRFKRECLQIPSNVGKAHSLKRKKKNFFRHIKMIRNKNTTLTEKYGGLYAIYVKIKGIYMS